MRGITWNRRAVATLLGLVLAMGIGWWPTLAVGAQVSGSGELRGSGASAAFVVQLSDATPLTFAYWDTSFDPARVVSMGDGGSVDCLGELFGGQTVRLSGSGFDSASPGEAVLVQIFLVDGRENGVDRLSLKVSQKDGAVIYFVPLRDIETGDITVSCSS